MRKRMITIGMVVVLVVIVFIVMLIDNSHKVDFEDETMAEMMAKTVGVESADELRINDLERITVLNIGYSGYYDTLADIEKCPNLEKLVIGYPKCPMTKYPFADKEMPELESEKRVKQIEKELENILKKCPNITRIYISNEKGNCELDNIEFLKEGKNLRLISLFYQSDIDYSPLSECRNLEFLSLGYCDVSDLSMLNGVENLKSLYLEETNVAEAEEILKLRNLNNLDVFIAGTPLAENEEQLEMIQQQFPGINIDTDY